MSQDCNPVQDYSSEAPASSSEITHLLLFETNSGKMELTLLHKVGEVFKVRTPDPHYSVTLLTYPFRKAQGR